MIIYFSIGFIISLIGLIIYLLTFENMSEFFELYRSKNKFAEFIYSHNKVLIGIYFVIFTTLLWPIIILILLYDIYCSIRKLWWRE